MKKKFSKYSYFFRTFLKEKSKSFKQGFVFKILKTEKFQNELSKIKLDPDKIVFDIDFRNDLDTKYDQVDFEVGHGNGEWIVKYSKIQKQKNPNKKYLIIGTEIQNPWFSKSVKKVSKSKSSAKVCKIDSVYFLEKHIKNHSLKNIFINFPDPWFKKKHLKRRIFKISFWQLCFLKLEYENSKIHFLSDNRDIFEFAKKEFFKFQEIAKISNLKFFNQKLTEKNIPKSYPESKYFRKWKKLNKNQKFHYFQIENFLKTPK